MKPNLKINYIPLLLLVVGLQSRVHAQTYYSPIVDTDYSYDENGIATLIASAAETRKKRVSATLEAYDGKGEGLREAMVPLIVNLYLGKDLNETNKMLHYVFTTDNDSIRVRYRIKDAWPLNLLQYIYLMHFNFGSEGRIAPGRLSSKTELAMLELLWDHLKYQNDIHLTRQSTWWMIGSENHDLHSKVSALLSSQIFMHHPKFKDRIYPDPGKGGGYGYYFHTMYGPGNYEGPWPRANDKDGKEYNAKDHYEAWVKYFEEYFTERAKKGFFLEMASSSYQGTTISYLTNIHEYCEDKHLAAKAKDFIDLFWMDWAQEQLLGERGGSRTRESKGSTRRKDGMYYFAEFYTGGPGVIEWHGLSSMMGTYEWPEMAWKIALDREGRGEYASIRRQIGEERNEMPRPLGTERTLVCDVDSRFLRYSWITPDYIMGCQMDYPLAVHSHLSIQNRWLGTIFKGEGDIVSRVFPTAYKYNAEEKKYSIFTDGYQRCVQRKNVMITQQSRGAIVNNPDWFPYKPRWDNQYGVWFGTAHDRIIEKGGWIFVENSDAYLAVRPLLGEYVEGGAWRITKDPTTDEPYSVIYENSYTWNDENTEIYLKDNYGGIIFESSRRMHYPTMEKFMEDILDNSITLQKTVVPGFNILRYTSCDGTEFEFNLANNEIPRINGEYISYTPEKVFQSPYINSVYNSGVVEVTHRGEKMVFDFNK